MGRHTGPVRVVTRGLAVPVTDPGLLALPRTESRAEARTDIEEDGLDDPVLHVRPRTARSLRLDEPTPVASALELAARRRARRRDVVPVAASLAALAAAVAAALLVR